MAKTRIAALLLCVSVPLMAHSEGSGKFSPSTVPVNIKPISLTTKRLGLASHKMSILGEWEDNLSYRGDETIGDLRFDVNNYALAFIDTQAEKSATERDIIIGTVSAETVDSSFFSERINRRMRIQAEVDGYDIGYRKAKSLRLSGTSEDDFELNFAYSWLLAYYNMDGEFSGYTDSPVTGSTYTEEEWGLFFRPTIALQPAFKMGQWAIIPYVGAATNLVWSWYYWEDTEYIDNGSSQPGQLSDGGGMEINLNDTELIYGIDIGLYSSHDLQHQFTLGGVINKGLGIGEKRVTEIHVLYSARL